MAEGSSSERFIAKKNKKASGPQSDRVGDDTEPVPLYTLSARLEIPSTGLMAERRRLPPPVTGGKRLGELRTSARPL
jgi:hypothetical protein